jgi:cell division protein FtsQ
MDGGRRLLRPLKEAFAAFEPSFADYAGHSIDVAVAGGRPVIRSAQRDRASGLTPLLTMVAARGANMVVSLVFLASVWLYGCVLNGQYAAFTATHGTLPDLVARSLGFRLKMVTILGSHELSEKQILDAAGIGPANSLLLLDVVRLRERLKMLPFVKEASVAKLYPNRLLIEIQERQPIALWQKDGQVSVIAADGTPIDKLHDARYLALPRTVGDGANAHVGDYLALLNAADDLRPRIEAGIFIAERRWTLKFKNGVEVALPEKGAAAALAKLVAIEHDYRLLEKDVVSLDLRIPGRLIATLPEDAARARMEMLAHRPKQTGAPT